MDKMAFFTVFLLFFQNTVYVGKTKSSRLSAVYHRHVRGEVFATKACVLQNPHPTLHIVCAGEMHRYEVYYRILAYVNILCRAGYTVLNSPQTIGRANDLHAPAKSIVEEIEKENLDKLLARTRVEKPTDADKQIVAAGGAPLRSSCTQKVTIRLMPNEKMQFKQLADQRGLSYRKLLIGLIDDNAHTDEGASMGKLTQEEKMAELEEKLRTQRAEFNERLAEKNRRIHMIQVGLATYFNLMRSTSEIPLAIGTGRYQDFAAAHKFVYPDEEGPYIVRPTAILYGKGRYPARFLLGIGDSQRQLKMRFYPGSCAGVSLTNENFGKRGTVWLLGGRRAPDGAMDLAFAFPLQVSFPYKDSSEYGSEMNRWVADLMREVEGYEDR